MSIMQRLFGTRLKRKGPQPQRTFAPAAIDGKLTQYKDGKVLPRLRPDGVKTRDTRPRGNGKYDFKRRMVMLKQLKEVSARG